MNGSQDSAIDAPAGRILLHAGDQALAAEAGLYDLVDGVVWHGRRGAALLTDLRSSNYPGILVWDPAEYDSNEAAGSRTLFDPIERAAAEQAALKVDVFLSPSPLPPQNDADGVKKALESGSRFLDQAKELGAIEAYVSLPLTPVWLRGKYRDQLIDDVTDAGLPIAPVLAAHGDPVDEPEALQTLLSVIDKAPSTFLLRSDLSAIGAVAYGAKYGAIGSSSTYRHFYLPSRGSSTPNTRRGHVYAPGLQNWLKRETLERLNHRDPNLVCNCEVSGGKSVLQYLPETEASRQRAERHAVLSWKALADAVLNGPTRSDRTNTWQEACLSALDAFESYDDLLRPPGYLVGWSGWSL